MLWFLIPLPRQANHDPSQFYDPEIFIHCFILVFSRPIDGLGSQPTLGLLNKREIIHGSMSSVDRIGLVHYSFKVKVGLDPVEPVIAIHGVVP